MDRLEIKSAFTAGGEGQFAGYASLFGKPSDSVRDIVAPGAFKASLARGLPQMKSEHGGPVIGDWTEVVEDDMGLRVKGRFDLSTPAGRRAYDDVVAGRRDGLSIGYYATKTAQERDGSRALLDVDLREISVVREPASSRSRILSVKSKDTSMENDIAAAIAPLETKMSAIDAAVKAIKSPDLAPFEARIADLEKKANRPHGASGSGDDQAALETKALGSFLRTGSDIEVKAAASDNAVDGGWMVLPTIDTSIRTLMTDLSPMRQLAEVVSINTAQYDRFYSLGKRGAQWVAERDDRPQDTARPELIKHSFGVAELYAAPAATRHLLDDAAVDIASWLINNATHDFAETEGEAFLRGDGVGGKPKGFLTYDVTNEKDFVRAWGKYGYVPAGHASSPTDANLTDALVKLVAAVRTPYKANAAFVMNSNTAVRLRTITDENGRYLWAPTGNLIEGIEHPLLGYRVVIDDNYDDIGAGTLPISFGDHRQAYVIVDRQGIRVERDTVTQKGRVLFDTYKRVGGGAGDFNAVKFMKVAAS
ncbi:MAG: phage major capsid protein [Xanthobacteraceae bacterium]